MNQEDEWQQVAALPYLVTSVGPVACWSVDDYVAVATEKVVYVLDATAFLEGTTRSALAAGGVTGPVRLLKGQITPSRQITGGEFQAKRLKLEDGEEEFHAAKLLSRRKSADKEVKLKAMELLEGGIKAATTRSKEHPTPVKKVSSGESKKKKKSEKKSKSTEKKAPAKKKATPKRKAKKRRSIVRSDSESEADDDDSDFQMESEAESSSSSSSDDASDLVPEGSEADELANSRPHPRASTASSSSVGGLGGSNLLGQCGGPAGVQDLWVGDVQRVAGANASTQEDILTLLQQHYSVMSTCPKSVHWSPGYACGHGCILALVPRFAFVVQLFVLSEHSTSVNGPDCPTLADLNPSEAWAMPPTETPPLITIEADGQCNQPIELGPRPPPLTVVYPTFAQSPIASSSTDAVVAWAPRKIGPISSALIVCHGTLALFWDIAPEASRFRPFFALSLPSMITSVTCQSLHRSVPLPTEMVLTKAETLRLDGAPSLHDMVDVVECPTVEVETVVVVVGMQSGSVMAACVSLAELPHGIVPLNTPKFIEICRLPSFIENVGCEVLPDAAAITEPKLLVHICAASTAVYEAKVVVWSEDSEYLQGPPECLSIPPVNTAIDDDECSPITGVTPLIGQGYFIMSKSAGTRIAVSALPDRLREISLEGFDPSSKLQGETISPNGTEIIAICCGGTVNKQQSRVMLNRSRKVMIEIEAAVTGTPTGQMNGIDDQANQLLRQILLPNSGNGTNLYDCYLSLLSGRVPPSVDPARPEVLPPIATLESINQALEFSLERVGVLPPGYSTAPLLVYNDSTQPIPASSSSMEVDGMPSNTRLEGIDDMLSKARAVMALHCVYWAMMRRLHTPRATFMAVVSRPFPESTMQNERRAILNLLWTGGQDDLLAQQLLPMDIKEPSFPSPDCPLCDATTPSKMIIDDNARIYICETNPTHKALMCQKTRKPLVYGALLRCSFCSAVFDAFESQDESNDKTPVLRKTATFTKDVVDKNKDTSYLRNRDCEGELVVVGQISHGFGFEPHKPSIGLRVELSVVFPGVEGDRSADGSEKWVSQCRKLGWMPISAQTIRPEQTQTCYTDGSRLLGTSVYPWNHPLDMYLAFNSVGSWPMLKLVVYAVDDTGDPERKTQARISILSYGLLPLPTKPGNHRLHCRTMRTIGCGRFGRFKDALRCYLGLPVTTAVPTNFLDNDRSSFVSVPSGTIVIDCEIIVRRASKLGLLLGGS
ncbi:hypothetical protein FOL47_008953 [Perkinsus chesapeaki]|uniref:B9 domain-containing protein 2 n=1 Tax=Perkinsus chesapeaki TaxID=330153 RepID=A0A7J6N1V3_PERCH|nr:hypothetical protein FOL47_008953 [Perkinsus chesapeaki]